MANDPLHQSPSTVPIYSASDVTLADVMRELALIRESNRQMSENINKINITLNGNGDPRKGLVFRILSLEDSQLYRTIASIVNFVMVIGIIIWLATHP